MNPSTARALRTCVRSQRRTMFPPLVAVKGQPIPTHDLTLGPGNRALLEWQPELLVQSKNDAAVAKYGIGATRVNMDKTHDPAIDKVDRVVFNEYPEPTVGRLDNNNGGEEFAKKMVSWPVTDDKYINYMLRPRTKDDHERRVTFYGLCAVNRGLWLFMGKSVAVTLVLFLGPGAAMKAASTVELDVSGIAEGQIKTVMWMGKPIFIHHRNEEQINKATSTPLSDLRDPETDADRHKDPKWAVMISICTHLGCIPVSSAGDYGAYLCPCHGSHYDFSGRIRKGPAPLNLEIPPYHFPEEGTLVIGKNA